MKQKYWDDFKVGDKVMTRAVTITETHIVNWASLTGDWYPLHVDEEYSKTTQFGGRIAHGPLTFGLAIGLMGTADPNPFGDSVVAWLGLDKLRALAPVRIGDTIHVEAEVVNKREAKRKDRGITIYKYVIKNQRDEEVMEFESSFMMHRRQ